MTNEEIEKEIIKTQNKIDDLNMNIVMLGADFLETKVKLDELKKQVNKIYCTETILPKGR
jgi:uncharacterized coiled-coil DUF342 family protein